MKLKAESLVRAVADTLVEVKARKLCDPLAAVKAKVLFDALADNLAENNAATPIKKL